MSDFFVGCRPGRQVTHGSVTFELPILYHRDDVFGLMFSCDLERARACMPSRRLHPVTLVGPERRAILGIFAFNYFDTSIGPYGEVAVVIPVMHTDEGSGPPPPVLPAFHEIGPPFKAFVKPAYGMLVLHLPVTKMAARDAGRGEWGFTKFIGDMEFVSTPEYHHLHLGEEGAPIFEMRVPKSGRLVRDNTPLTTYSVLDGNLIKTLMPKQSIRRNTLIPRGWALELGSHPVAQSIRDLGLSPRPLLARTILEKSVILPSGEIVERGVDPLDGYKGSDRVGEYFTRYFPSRELR